MASGNGRDLGFAELIALLSLGTDLGLGQPMDHMVRACLIALRLAEHLDESQRTVLYYSGLLAWRAQARLFAMKHGLMTDSGPRT